MLGFENKAKYLCVKQRDVGEHPHTVHHGYLTLGEG